MPVNYVLLCVISGIIGLVMTGFTAWHLSLIWTGQTTIESLEKTRYLSPLRKSMKMREYGNGPDRSYGEQLVEIHANAIPGVTRREEGESMPANGDYGQELEAQRSLRRNYQEIERRKERERYENYLDEQDSEQLPHAFDLGWRRNLRHLFGERPLFWFLPMCNTTGDGWRWEPSPKWLDAREDIRRERETRHDYSVADGHLRTDGPDDDDTRFDSHAWPHHSHGSSERTYFSDESSDSKLSMRTLRRRESFGESHEREDDSNAGGPHEGPSSP